MSGTFWNIEQVEPIIRERDKLRAENEAMKDEVLFLNKQQQLDNDDAERYRWLLPRLLLKQDSDVWWIDVTDDPCGFGVFPNVQEAIDAAREE